MATAQTTRAAPAQSFVLRIPGSAETGRAAIRREVISLDNAVRLYEAARDASGEGASTFAPGSVTGPGGARWRISYNGRIQPSKAVRPAIPADAETGMAWYNGLSKAERAHWHDVAGSAVPADAWAAWKAAQEAGR